MSTTTPLPSNEPPVFSYTSNSARLPPDSASPHIRLLRLHGAAHASNGDPLVESISADIFVSPISSAPEFKALSYTWGTDERTHRISLSGAAFYVTPSLNLALRHLRLESGQPVVFWIDQICINQDDDAEKTVQVNLMHQIYTGAEQVVVWLGPAADDSDKVMDYLSTIGGMVAVFRFTNDSLESMSNLEFPDEKINTYARDPDVQLMLQFLNKLRSGLEPLLPAFIAWCQRPWFTRLWVVQEAALNVDTVFLCGYRVVSADTITLAITLLKPYFPRVVAALQPLADRACEPSPTPKLALSPCQFEIRRRYQSAAKLQAEAGLPLLDLLNWVHIAGGTCATRVEDRIFGLLALAGDAKRLGISADYTGSDIVALLSHVAASIMSDLGCLNLLGLAQSSEQIPGLPSWVPDWGPYNRPPFYWLHADKCMYSASGHGKAGKLLRSGLVLEVEGVQVDTVEKVCFLQTDGGDDDCDNPLLLVRSIVYLAMLSREKDRPLYTEPRRRLEIPWRVPIGDLENVGGKQWLRRASSVIERCFFELWESFEEANWSSDRWKEVTQLNSDGTGSATGVTGQGTYLSSMAKMRRMRPFLTNEGYVGLGPLTLRHGDVIMVLKGASVPFALRPVAGEANQFTLVGPTYCDGVMDGEIMTGNTPIPISLV